MQSSAQLCTRMRGNTPYGAPQDWLPRKRARLSRLEGVREDSLRRVYSNAAPPRQTAARRPWDGQGSVASSSRRHPAAAQRGDPRRQSEPRRPPRSLTFRSFPKKSSLAKAGREQPVRSCRTPAGRAARPARNRRARPLMAMTARAPIAVLARPARGDDATVGRLLAPGSAGKTLRPSAALPPRSVQGGLRARAL